VFKNLGIGTRLGVGFAIVLVLMVVQAVISYSRMATLQNRDRRHGARQVSEDRLGPTKSSTT
jgi:hypothetical protein